MLSDLSTLTEAEAEGFTHLSAHCQGCGRTTMLPFALIRAEGQASPETSLAAIAGRLRCSKCGKPPTTWEPWNQTMAPNVITQNKTGWMMMSLETKKPAG